MPKKGQPSPQKGQPRSEGLNKDFKKQFAKDIRAAGGPHKFEEKHTLAEFFKQNRDAYGSYVDNNKKAIQNLWQTWKVHKTYEQFLDKVYIPVVVNNCVKNEAESTPTAAPQPVPDYIESSISLSSSKPKLESVTAKPPKTTSNPQAKMTSPPCDAVYKPGDIIVVPLSRGLVLAVYWVDSKLCNMDVRVSEDGCSVLQRSLMSYPKTASELLSHYQWGQNPTNMGVGALDTLIAHNETGQQMETDEWSEPEVILSTTEPMVRTFVDIEGNETGHIGYNVDSKGRQTITFILKTERSTRSTPSKGVFTNQIADYDEETIPDAKVSDLEAKIAQQAEQMNQMNAMLMQFMQMQMMQQPTPMQQPAPVQQPMPMQQPMQHPLQPNTNAQQQQTNQGAQATPQSTPSPTTHVTKSSATLAQQVANAAARRNIRTDPPKSARKNPPTTPLQEDRKDAYDKKRRVPSSKQAREGSQARRQSKKREAKLSEMRRITATLPPIPNEIKSPSPISDASTHSVDTNSFLESVDEAEADMKETLSEGEAVLNGMKLPKKRWKLEMVNENDWENL